MAAIINNSVEDNPYVVKDKTAVDMYNIGANEPRAKRVYELLFDSGSSIFNNYKYDYTTDKFIELNYVRSYYKNKYEIEKEKMPLLKKTFHMDT